MLLWYHSYHISAAYTEFLDSLKYSTVIVIILLKLSSTLNSSFSNEQKCDKAGSVDRKMAAEKEELYLVILGDGGVGKSAITIQFCQKRFQDHYDPTIEDTYRKEITVQCGKKDKETKTFDLEILDSAGQVNSSPFRQKNAIKKCKEKVINVIKKVTDFLSARISL